jgi:membrane protease YdiL (CAAX protease family)
MNFDLGDWRPSIEAALLLLLLVCGLALLRRIERRLAPLRVTLGLPRRATSRAEWATGAAIGWGIAVASVLPMALARTLNTQLWMAPRAYLLFGLSLLTLALLTLAHTLAIYGYGFQRLIDAIGPVRATVVLVALVTVVHSAMPAPYGTPDGTRILVDLLMTLLLCLCWMRTHAVWLAWGLHFAWASAIAVLFGLPIAGQVSFGSVVDTRAVGPAWLTGGAYGPAAALLTVVFFLAAIPILVRASDDYAWKYTHPPLIPGGYDVTIAPPAAHVAMEQAAESALAVNPASLVQIQPSPAQSPTADTASE